MYGRNDTNGPYKWIKGQKQDAERPERHMSLKEIAHATKELDNYRITLEQEIIQLEASKKELEGKFPDPECEKKFRIWGGSEIQDSTDKSFCINFLPHMNGKICETFSIGLDKPGPFWILSHHNLPYSIDNVRRRVAAAQINTVDKLSSFIRCLQLEINMFILRREQFNEAKALASPSFEVFPSVNTKQVMLSFRVKDDAGSDLSKASVFLKYQSHKYLPDEPIFTFAGGDKAAQSSFREQLVTLECMPLRDAIVAAFPTANANLSLSEPLTQIPPEEVNHSKSSSVDPPSSPVGTKQRQSSVLSPDGVENSQRKRALAESNQNVDSPPTPPASSHQRGRGKGRGRGGPRGRRGPRECTYDL